MTVYCNVLKATQAKRESGRPRYASHEGVSALVPLPALLSCEESAPTWNKPQEAFFVKQGTPPA